jgi:hypothetical protein
VLDRPSGERGLEPRQARDARTTQSLMARCILLLDGADLDIQERPPRARGFDSPLARSPDVASVYPNIAEAGGAITINFDEESVVERLSELSNSKGVGKSECTPSA